MKFHFGFSLATMMILSSTQDALASQPVSKCTFTINDKNNGDLVTRGDGFIRLDHTDRLGLRNSFSELKFLSLLLTNVQTSPDSESLSLTSKRMIPGSFYNENGTIDLGGTFGDAKIFGTLNCVEPLIVPFYFVSADSQVLLHETNPESLYAIITQAGACVSGDLQFAAHDLNQHWEMPIENLKATSHGLEWTEVVKECLDSEPSGDHPGDDCYKWHEISRRQVSLNQCALND